MIVRVTMNDGTLYKGVKCGLEGGLLYLINPVELSEDLRGDIPGEWESPVGEEIYCGHEKVRVLLVPMHNIKLIVSAT